MQKEKGMQSEEVTSLLPMRPALVGESVSGPWRLGNFHFAAGLAHNLLWSDALTAGAAVKFQQAASSQIAEDLLGEIQRDVREIKQLLAQHLAAHQREERMQAGPEVIELRDIDAAQARREIENLFAEREGQTLYYEDICDKLRLPLQQVLLVCQQLEAEGRIGEAGE